MSARLVEAPSTPSWVKVPSVTTLAGARAARGAEASADRMLRTSARAGDAASRAWFSSGVLLLAAARGRTPGPTPAWLLADTTTGGVLAAGLWAAMAGDTSTAAARLTTLQQLPAVRLKRLGHGACPDSRIQPRGSGRWSEVVAQLAPAAAAGEPDGGDLDQVSAMAVRWLMGDAYYRMGKADSAAAMYERVLDPSRTPFSHLALRGLVHSFASRRLALIYEELGRPGWRHRTGRRLAPPSSLRIPNCVPC